MVRGRKLKIIIFGPTYLIFAHKFAGHFEYHEAYKRNKFFLPYEGVQENLWAKVGWVGPGIMIFNFFP